jgi:pyruvate,water dikinase
MQSLLAQLGGDPAEVTDLMGGEPAPAAQNGGRLPWWRLVRAGVLIWGKLIRAPGRVPAWFAEMRRLAEAQADPEVDRLTEQELLARLLALDEALHACDLTFALVGRISQALMVLRFTLQRRLGQRWRPLLNAATRGMGTIISAKQISWLVELAERAGAERNVRDFLLEDPWQPETFRCRLAGTAFLTDLDRFLAEYGHRAVGESDPMAPRFAERPEYVLGIVRGHLQASSFRTSEAARREQERARAAALGEIRKAFAWRLPAWLLFRWWHRALCRAQELREANRHALMRYLAGVKRLFLILGRKLVNRGLLDSPEDLFFLVPDETRALVADLPGAPRRDWKSLVARRRVEMARHAAEAAPDVIGPSQAASPPAGAESPGALKGLPISGGYAEGPVRVILSPESLGQVRGGDVLVMPAIDPGMAPLMGLASALVIEMGGMLSHGAIIAREYGIPAVANVRQATRRLKDGERVAVDAGRGEVRRLPGQ